MMQKEFGELNKAWEDLKRSVLEFLSPVLKPICDWLLKLLQ